MIYQHLSLAERHYFEIQLKAGISTTKIAKSLKRSPSTLSRELKRNIGKRGYRHKQANHFSQERHQSKNKSIKLTKSIN